MNTENTTMNSKTNTVRAILLDASECDRPEADHPATIEISAEDLQRILERHITEPSQCLHQIAEPAAVQAAAPMFWVRLLRDGLYEGPVHNNSASGKLLRDEKPGEWHPLYLHPAEGVPAGSLKLPPLPEPSDFLVCKGSEVTARAWNVDQMRAYAAAAIAATRPTQQGLDAQDAERFRGFAACMLRQDCAFEDAVEAYPKPDFEIATIDDVRAMVDAGIAAAQAKQGGA